MTPTDKLFKFFLISRSTNFNGAVGQVAYPACDLECDSFFAGSLPEVNTLYPAGNDQKNGFHKRYRIT